MQDNTVYGPTYNSFHKADSDINLQNKVIEQNKRNAISEMIKRACGNRENYIDQFLVDRRGENKITNWEFDVEKAHNNFSEKVGKIARAMIWVCEGFSNSVISKRENEIINATRGFCMLEQRYIEMKLANTKKADDYYHCLGFCESASQGQGGLTTAKIVSQAREVSDFVPNVLSKGLDVAIEDRKNDLRINELAINAGLAGIRCHEYCMDLNPYLKK